MFLGPVGATLVEALPVLRSDELDVHTSIRPKLYLRYVLDSVWLVEFSR